MKRRIELSNQVTKLKGNMDKSARQLLDDYLDVIESIYSGQVNCLYLQGVRDCIRV